MIQSFSAFVGVAVATITCLAAMVLGGPTERFAGALLLVVNFTVLVIQSHSDWSGPQYWMLAIDIVVFAVAIVLVLKTDRAWTVGLAAYYALTVMTHLVMLLEPVGDRPAARTWAYITGIIVWGYLIWVFLAWGTWSAWRERSRSQNTIDDAASGRNPQRSS